MEQYFPKRPVKSFLDLEVYQMALATAVFITRYVIERPDAERPDAEVVLPFGNRSHSEISAKGQNIKKRQESEDKNNIGTGTDNVGSGRSDAEVVLPFGNRSQRDMLSTAGNFGSGTAKSLIFHNMLPCALGLPHLIAEAHSYRFGNQPECLQLLEKAMLHCNKMIVYLEETRDIIETGVEWEKFDETIKKYQYLRRKLLNLQRSWKKYMQSDN